MASGIGEASVLGSNHTRALLRLGEDLRAALGRPAVRVDEPLARYTSLRIGGSADLLVVAEDVAVLRQVLVQAWDHELPWRILGSGSNVLVSDAGVRGLVILNRARRVSFSGTGVHAESGASLSTVAQKCAAQGLAGLVWATGIPGTVGGAVVGNAGAWGGDVASTLVRATVLEPPGVVTDWPVERFEYAYRTSRLKQRGGNGVATGAVLEAEFAVQKGERKALQAKVAEIAAQRRESQPSGATCGSVFRNPAGDYAGRLIEAAGLKGRRSGEAEISLVHANFIINHGRASAEDVKTLIDLAGQEVKDKFGVMLELEIELIGEW